MYDRDYGSLTEEQLSKWNRSEEMGNGTTLGVRRCDGVRVWSEQIQFDNREQGESSVIHFASSKPVELMAGCSMECGRKDGASQVSCSKDFQSFQTIAILWTIQWHNYGAAGPAAAGVQVERDQKGPIFKPYRARLGIGAHFWDPAGPEIWSYATGSTHAWLPTLASPKEAGWVRNPH